MEDNAKITLVVVCDNHLVVMLAVLLKSIEIYHKNENPIDIFIINDGLYKSNVDKINNTISSKNIKIIWKNMKEAIPNGIRLPVDKTSFPVCAYARICTPHFLPSEVKKAIYLDVDMILLRDIQELWNTDINNQVIAAVIDRSEKVSSPWGGIKNYKELGMDPETKYFNSGLLVIDLEKWRQMNATQLVINAVTDNYEFVSFADQYGLNIVFANNWFPLNPKWNSYSQNDDSDPFLIHFTGMKPLFKGYSFNNEYKSIFYNILNLTPWKSFLPKSDYSRFAKKAWNIITKKVISSFKVLV